MNTPARDVFLGLLIVLVFSGLGHPFTENAEIFTKTVCTRDHTEMNLTCPYNGTGTRNKLIYIRQTSFGAQTGIRKKRGARAFDWSLVSRDLHKRSLKENVTSTDAETCQPDLGADCILNADIETYQLCKAQADCVLNAAVVGIKDCFALSDYLTVDFQCLPGNGSDVIDVCSSVQYDTDSYGYLVSSRYPRQYYPYGLACVCTLETTQDGRFEMEFLDFDLEYDDGCAFDSVTVSSAVGSHRFCGTLDGRHKRVLPHHTAAFRFSTDDSFPFRGFWIMLRASADDGSDRPLQVTCGLNTTDAGIVNSSSPLRNQVHAWRRGTNIQSLTTTAAINSTVSISKAFTTSQDNTAITTRTPTTTAITTEMLITTHRKDTFRSADDASQITTSVTASEISTEVPSEKPKASKYNTGLIVGIAAGGLFFLILAAIGTVVLCKKLLDKTKDKDIEQHPDIYINKYSPQIERNGNLGLEEMKSQRNKNDISKKNDEKKQLQHSDTGQFDSSGHVSSKSVEVNRSGDKYKQTALVYDKGLPTPGGMGSKHEGLYLQLSAHNEGHHDIISQDAQRH